MATKYLQLRVHGLQCLQKSTNVQNFLGIPLETDPNSIDLSAIVTDAAEGLVARGPTVFLGNRYDNGRRETWADPKVVAEIPFSDDDSYPRRVAVSLNMAEKDDGAGFNELMDDVAGELAETLSREVGEELDASVSESEYYDDVWKVVEQAFVAIFRAIGDALGLQDDPFRPINLDHELRSFAHAPSGTSTITLHEAAPHQGKYVLTYGWHVSSTRAIGDTVGAATGALVGKGDDGRARRIAPAPYPRPFRTYRFARPMKKRAVVVKPPFRKIPWFWHATPIKLFTNGDRPTK